MVPIRELGPNPYIYLITPTHVQMGVNFPDHIRLSLVCTAITHRANRTAPDGIPKALDETFYRYRGRIIRSLREDIANKEKCTSDIVLAGTLTLLVADVG